MVCNGSPATQIGRCVISPRDEWLHYGCLPDYTSSPTGCHAYKVAAVDGQQVVQDAPDCSLRHADPALPTPVWRSDGGGNPRCATLEANEFLELKSIHTLVTTQNTSLRHTMRLVVLDNGDLQFQYVAADDSTSIQHGSKPFEAIYTAGTSIGTANEATPYFLLLGSFVPPHSRLSVGRPPYRARITQFAIELVNARNTTYWRAPYTYSYHHSYPIGVQWSAPNVFGVNLAVCGVLASTSPSLCQAADCSDKRHCEVLATVGFSG